MRLSPDAIAAEISKAGAFARSEDVRLIREASSALSQSIGRVDGIVKRGQSVDGQQRRLVETGLGALVLGMLIWAILPGAIARSVPASWHVPEWTAVRTLRLDGWQAGQVMMTTADPARWRQIVELEAQRDPALRQRPPSDIGRSRQHHQGK